jgi:hypothetical protein
MRRSAVGGGTPSQNNTSSKSENSESALDLPVGKLRQVFCFFHLTACTIATLAYGVVR